MPDRPVVIIPGYYGSELFDQKAQVEVWLTGDSLLHAIAVLEAIRLDTGDPSRIVANGPLDHIEVFSILRVEFYGKLRQYLLDVGGYAPGDVHVIGVDWRQSLTTLAGDLKTIIDGIAAPSVDIVTHSHGGLVARAYLAASGPGKVNSLITIAAPHKGMLKTFDAIYEGFQFATFPPDHLRRTARTFPSAYELLPFAADDGLFTWNGNNADPRAVNDWCETDVMKKMLADSANVIGALPSQLPVDATFIYGTRLETQTVCKGTTTGLTFETTTDGDSTVAIVSASGANVTSTGKLRRYPIPFAVHGSMFADRRAQDIMLACLRGTPPAVWFDAVWSEPLPYMIHSKHTLVVELRDEWGNPIDQAKVTVTIAGDQTYPVEQQDPWGDYAFDYVMPGPDTHVDWTVRAEAPGQAPLEKSGRIFAANN
jgi:pimeloyl-ACP methyl ester carboxylesterase